jgi:tetratricopeptide (TPR) repeat protein
MIEEHLDRRALDDLLAGAIAGRRGEEHLFHLLVCEECRRSLLETHPEEGPLFFEQMFGDTPGWIHPQSHLARDPALQREVLAAPHLLNELLGHPHARRLLLVRNASRFQSVAVAAACLGEGRRLFQHDPKESQHWADLAAEILDTLSGERYPPALVASFRARTWAYRANALRNQSAFDEAERAFAEAWVWFWKGTPVPTEWAKLAALEASLRRDQRRFRAAHGLLQDAIEIYRQEGDRREESRLVVARAFVLGEEGRQEEAVEVLEKALERFTRDELEEFIYLAAIQNLASSLVELGRPAEALPLLPEIRRLTETRGDRLLLLRLDWLEAAAHHGTGDREEALELYLKVQGGFVEMGIAYDAALVSLELATLYLETGRTAEVKELASQMLPIFRSRQIHREAAATGLVLIEALRRDAATVDLVQQVEAYMKRSRGANRGS